MTPIFKDSDTQSDSTEIVPPRRVRLFPLLIGVAGIALISRTIDIYTGVNLMVSAARAEQEATTAPAAEHAPEGEAGHDAPVDAAASHEGAAPATDSGSPTIIGLPSSEEMELLSQLRQRRLELDKRARELDEQEKTLLAFEKRIDDKIGQLKTLEEQVKKHLKVFDDQEAEQLASIVKVYETMAAKEAAPRFEMLSLETQMDLVTRMKPAKVAALMAKMSPDSASRLTTQLANVAQAPKLEDIQGNN